MFGFGRHLANGDVTLQPAESAGVDQRSTRGAERQQRLNHCLLGIIVDGKHHQPDFQFVLLRELVVALVVRRHTHDGAGTVVHQDVVGHPDGNLLTVERIHRIAMRVDAVLFNGANVPVFFCLALLGNQLLDRFPERLVVVRKIRDQGMLRCEHDRSCAKDRIDARGKHADGRA